MNKTSTSSWRGWAQPNQTSNFRGGWLQTILEWGKLLGDTLKLTEEEKERWLYE